MKIATRLAQSPGGTLPQAMPQWGELKAAYRFFSQPQNTYEQILRPHWERTQAAGLAPGEYLLIEDTTLLDYTLHNAVEGLGMIGDRGRGLSLHSTLAMKVVAWDLEQRPEAVVVGLLGPKAPAAGRNPLRTHVAQSHAPNAGPRYCKLRPDRPPAALGRMGRTGRRTSTSRSTAASNGAWIL